MRLTGGSDRGRRLKAPRGLHTRPTAAKVREAIFNILGRPPEGAVLDLFAGTGALGLEALSRGAPAAVFVERDRHALHVLRDNLRELGADGKATVIAADVRSAIRRLAAQVPVENQNRLSENLSSESRSPDTRAPDCRSGEHRFCWVFMDPPYVQDVSDILGELSDKDLLAPCAVVVVEHDRRHRPPASIGGLFLTDRREYGDTELSFYRSGRS